MRPILNYSLPFVMNDSPWSANYPNPPDLNFNYYNLLDKAYTNNNAIGKAGKEDEVVAIIGAGAAGLAAARELYRCGFKVKIFEATSRICGRQYTYDATPGKESVTGMELGAMRFPFFTKPGGQNCLLDYYLNNEANVQSEAFPNPGAAPGNTGIYINRGYGPNSDFDRPKLISWPASQSDYNPPDDKSLKQVYDKVIAFVKLFTDKVSQEYVTSDWPKKWQEIANNYEQMTVSDLVFTAAVTKPSDSGWYGGFGMTDEEAQLFALIGSGDGSWGAFYEVGAMWFIRCVIFGYNSDLHSIIGIEDKGTLPYYNKPIEDSNGNDLDGPLYNGIQTLGEWLLYATPPGMDKSLFDATKEDTDVKNSLLTQTAVTAIERRSGDKGYRIHFETNSGLHSTEVKYVVVTPTLWASQFIKLVNFGADDVLPPTVVSARNSQHNITSCKVFYALKEAYWEKSDSKIPQILVTDTFMQDAYGVKWGDKNPVLLVSYTWEDDAVKVLPEEGGDLANLMLDKMVDIVSETTGEDLRSYIDNDIAPKTIHWARQEYFRGCAKLYRQRNWTLNYALLSYNQQHAKNTGIYFAGENYGVEGGWTEPALRLAIDAVINIVKNSGGRFNNGFNSEVDYPKYDVDFKPENKYPSPQT